MADLDNDQLAAVAARRRAAGRKRLCECPSVYDVSEDALRPVTQADVDLWQRAIVGYSEVLRVIGELNGKVAAAHIAARDAFAAASGGSAA